MKIKFSKLMFRKKSNAQLANEKNGPSTHITPTDEEIQFGFNNTVNNSKANRQSLPRSPAKNDYSKQPSARMDGHKSTKTVKNGPKYSNPSNSSSPQKRHSKQHHSKQIPSSSTSRGSSSNDQPRYFKYPPPGQYVNGKLGSIDEEQDKEGKQLPNHRHHSSNAKLERNNSMLKLESWVQNQRTKQQYRKSDSSRASSTARFETGSAHGPRMLSPGGRRWKPRSASDYMNRSEPASSILSVPIIRHQNTTSLTRPRSSQDINRHEQSNRQIVNWKSVGYLSPASDRDTHLKKSEQVKTRNRSGLASPKGNSYSTQSLRRPHDGRLTNPLTSPLGRTPSFFEAVTTGNPTVRFKQTYQHQPTITNQAVLRPSEQIRTEEKLNGDIIDEDLEDEMKRFDLLVATNQQLSKEIKKLERQMIEGSKPTSPRDSLLTLQSRFNRIKEKLIYVRSEGELVLDEMNALKKKKMKELTERNDSRKKQFELEWKLGRIQIALEKLKSMNDESMQQLNNFNEPNSPFDLTTPDKISSPRSNISSSSPNNVKRSIDHHRVEQQSTRVRSPRNKNKFSTMPRPGVYRSTSTNSLTSGSVARFTRPLSSQPTNLQRTKSAAERLLFSSQGNLARSHDPEEIKKIQQEISRSRRRTLSAGAARKPLSMPLNTANRSLVGMDVKMAMKNYRMPKVLQRSKQQRAEMDRISKQDHNIRVFFYPDRPISTAETVELAPSKTFQNESPTKADPDDNLKQLVDIENTSVPRGRILKSTSDSLIERAVLEKKINAIEKIMPVSGQNEFQHSSARLAAALAAEAATASRILTGHTSPNDSCFA